MKLETIWKNFINSQYSYWFKEEINKTELEIEILKNKHKAFIVKLNEKDKEIRKLKKLAYREEVKVFGTITNATLRRILEPHSNTVRLSDNIYSTTTVDEAKAYSKSTSVSIKEYTKNNYDCDEFSFALMGYWNLDLYQFAFGIAWSKTHAFNIMIDNDNQIWIVEPQNNRFYKIEVVKNKKEYYPIDVIMI